MYILAGGILTTPITQYVNIALQNQAGSRVTLTWRDGIRELDIDEGTHGTFEYTIISYSNEIPKYQLMVVRYGTNDSQLINGQSLYELSSSTTNTTSVTLTITASKQGK